MSRRPPLMCLAALFASLAPGLTAPSSGQDMAFEDGPYVIWNNPDEVEILSVRDGQAVRTSRSVEESIVIDAPFLRDGGLRISRVPPVVEPSVHEGVERLFVVGDIHGMFEVAIELLQSNGVIDQGLHWSFGDGHLVFDGDIFDRGDHVTQMLWLIYRLEQEAKAAGGRVHLVLGNHEVMPLLEDLRYVNPSYLDVVAPALGMTYPEMFGPGTELGRWLRTKHAVIRINRMLFVHGGLSPGLLDRGLDMKFINETIRANLDTPYDDIKADETLAFLFRSEGPLWYRGYFIDWSDYLRTTPDKVRQVLDAFKADHVIVAHTGATEIHSVFRGMVINVHVKMTPGVPAEALRWENGEFIRVNSAGLRQPLDLANETWLEAE